MIRIEPLLAIDSEAAVQLLNETDDDEGRFFDGLPKESETLRSTLLFAKEDRYWAIRVEDEFVGLFMLRGFDAGYSSPAFGLFIKREFREVGLGQLALQYAETWCRLRNIETMMLTVAEENRRALALYEARGFMNDGERSPRGNLVFRKRLTR
jgi:ribosomal protein S18 acetylase RimI-like enzyme